jgi:hypothetical protein
MIHKVVYVAFVGQLGSKKLDINIENDAVPDCADDEASESNRQC